MTGFMAKSLAATVSVIQRIMPINQMIRWGWKAPSKHSSAGNLVVRSGAREVAREELSALLKGGNVVQI